MVVAMLQGLIPGSRLEELHPSTHPSVQALGKKEGTSWAANGSAALGDPPARPAMGKHKGTQPEVRTERTERHGRAERETTDGESAARLG